MLQNQVAVLGERKAKGARELGKDALGGRWSSRRLRWRLLLDRLKRLRLGLYWRCLNNWLLNLLLHRK